jgi:hypothetical protein
MTAYSTRKKFRIFLVVLITTLTIGSKTGIVFGQCDFDWKPGQNLPGLNGWVFAVTPWDPDGEGPQPDMLIAGGYFYKAGGGDANAIAAWDGNNWLPLGGGMDDDNVVRALVVSITAGLLQEVGLPQPAVLLLIILPHGTAIAGNLWEVG